VFSLKFKKKCQCQFHSVHMKNFAVINRSSKKLEYSYLILVLHTLFLPLYVKHEALIYYFVPFVKTHVENRLIKTALSDHRIIFLSVLPVNHKKQKQTGPMTRFRINLNVLMFYILVNNVTNFTDTY